MRIALLKYLEHNIADVVGLVSKLIEIRTVNPPGENYEGMVSFLEKECILAGLKTRRYLTPKKVMDKSGLKGGSKRISLVADWRKFKRKKTLHVNSHYDVVPVGDKWHRDPFRAFVNGNKIYGRGSEDMKGNIACLLFALQAIKECGIKPKLNLQFSFTPDEEIGGRTGLGYLVQRNLVKADYAMSEGYSGDYVSMGNKGVLWAEITVNGRSSHASLPHKGINSFERMIDLASHLEKLKKRISRRKTGYHIKPAFPRSPSLVMGGLLEGGCKVNVVPDVVRFSIDRRLIPEEDVKLARGEIEEVIKRFNKRYRDSRASAKFNLKENPSISVKDEKFFKTVSDSVRSVTGKKAKFSIMPGATDIRYFMWKGVPALGYSAKGGESWHSDNEFVYIDSLVDTAKVYALVMSSLE